MNSLPELDLTFDPLTRILYGAIPSKLLLTAIELGVFSLLTAPKSADVLARAIDTHHENTGLFLDALVANELLCKQDGQYRNTPLADSFLVKDRPTYLGDAFTNLAGYMQPSLENMTTLVKNGPPPRGDPMSPALRAQETAAIVGELPELPGMKKMLDLGGGAGLITLAIVGAHPTMAGVIFDRPEVVEVAQRFIHEYDLADRVTVMGGDFTKDSIGSGYDLVWTSSVLGRGNLDQMPPKIHASLNTGGIHINLGEGLIDERTQPATTVNSMLAVGLRSDDRLLEEGEMAQAMRRAGFRSVDSRTTEDPQACGATRVDIARK